MLILLIDDDATFRMRMLAQLQKEGHEVLVANDGTIGLRLAMDSDPDLVLVDQMMEGISGDEVVATLRRDLPDVPAVVVTGLDSPQDVVKSLQAGAFDYLTKGVFASLNHIGEHALAQGLDMGGIDGLVKDRETLLAHGARSFHDMCSLQLAAVPLPRTDFDLGQYVILARWRLDCRSFPHRDTSMLL